MLEDLQSACESCGAQFETAAETMEPALVMRTVEGVRRAYECSCGAVTITVVRD